MLILNDTEITGNYNISYNNVSLSQIDVVKDGNRYTVWRHGEIVIFIDGTSFNPIQITCGSFSATIPTGTSGAVVYNDINVLDTDALTVKEQDTILTYTLYSGTSRFVKLTVGSSLNDITLNATITNSGRQGNVTQTITSNDPTYKSLYPIRIYARSGVTTQGGAVIENKYTNYIASWDPVNEQEIVATRSIQTSGDAYMTGNSTSVTITASNTAGNKTPNTDIYYNGISLLSGSSGTRTLNLTREYNYYGVTV